MIRVFVPSFRQVFSDNEKTYTVFNVEVNAGGRYHAIQKRYSEFHSLHKQIKKVMPTPEFPPKRVRNFNQKVLEERRRGLETYLQCLLQQDRYSKSLLTFLAISPNLPTADSFESVDHLGQENGTSHQPVLTFVRDPFLDDTSSGGLEDIVVQGVVQGLYTIPWKGSCDLMTIVPSVAEVYP